MGGGGGGFNQGGKRQELGNKGAGSRRKNGTRKVVRIGRIVTLIRT